PVLRGCSRGPRSAHAGLSERPMGADARAGLREDDRDPPEPLGPVSERRVLRREGRLVLLDRRDPAGRPARRLPPGPRGADARRRRTHHRAAEPGPAAVLRDAGIFLRVLTDSAAAAFWRPGLGELLL